MTVCLYINPSGCPSIISDCLVSEIGRAPVTPTTVLNCHDLSIIGEPSLLTSKMCHEHGDTLLSFAANNAHNIFQFREDFSDYYRLTYSSNRPSRFTAARVSEFNEHRSPQEQIHILGFAPDDSRTAECGWSVNIVSPDKVRPGLKTQHFNECFAIGSGARQMLDKIADFDRAVSTFPESAKRDTYALTLGLVGALNSERLFGLNNFSASHWGGYLQWRGFSLTAKTWAWQPSWLHVLYFVISDADSTRLFAHPRFAAYDSYGLWAELTAVSILNNQAHYCKWQIENLFHPTARPEHTRNNLEGFRAEQLTLTILYYTENCTTSIHRTLTPAEMRSSDCDFNTGRFRLDIPWEVLSPILAQTLNERDYERLCARNR